MSILAGFRAMDGQATTRPITRRDATVAVYHGVKVPDPYRWLEDDRSSETQAWIEAQGALTADFLAAIPERQALRERLTELWNYPRHSAPSREGDRYFFSKNDGLQNQSVLYVQTGLAGEPRVLLDPNALSPDGTVALTNSTVSEDGKLLAYGLSSHGSDWQDVRVRDIDAGKEFDDLLKWCRFSSIAWKHDGEGFFYNRFPDPATVPEADRTFYNRVYYHKIGTPQSQDPLIYERPEAKDLGFAPMITDDGKYLLLYVFRGTSPKNRIYYRKVESDGPFVRLLDDADASYDFVGNVGPVFYFKTDYKAPRGRIIAIDTQNPARENWNEIIPEGEDALSGAAVISNRLIIEWMHNVHSVLKTYSMAGEFEREIPLPALGSVAGITGRPRDSEMFVAFTSFLIPQTIYRYDFTTSELQPYRTSSVDYDFSRYETDQVFCRSKDGTTIPIFITHKKGLTLDGNNPTLLYGYGGFNISLTPNFSIPPLVWLERGGVHAVANLRGGAEFGEAWHEAGMRECKQNVFDDFIAAAEWLIENKYTRPSRLAIQGGSNGGLLVSACMVQRPRPLRRRRLPRPADRHAALSQVHRRPLLDA